SNCNGQEKVERRFQIKYSMKIYNYNYLMPTAILLVLLCTKMLSIKDVFRQRVLMCKLKYEAQVKFTERFRTLRISRFFQTLKF
ncbi:PREDICTED: 60S ribosomal protein L27, partial [Eurypyga helias]|uniref:60S ribosomal protein L27 n=1 Tax=Eurypyga helias TaxID=54383 RepID=UPI000528940E